MTQIWSIFKQMFENTVHFQTKFDSVEIREYLNLLTLERAVIVVADTFYRTVDQSSFDQTDKWFGTRWKVATDPYEYMPIDGISEKLYFPPVNPYFTWRLIRADP